jgi:DNA-directed RNA polymerase sigma subunit (sigma70/sigma32)
MNLIPALLEATSHYQPTLEIETLKLVWRAQAGDRDAFDELTLRNVRLISSVAFRHFELCSNAVELTDLFQYAAVGFVKAALGFKRGQGSKFSTYATAAMHREVKRNVANFAHAVRLPVHLQARLRKINRARAALTATQGRSPTASELAARVGLTERQVAKTLSVPIVVASLDDEQTERHVAPLQVSEVEMLER